MFAIFIVNATAGWCCEEAGGVGTCRENIEARSAMPIHVVQIMMQIMVQMRESKECAFVNANLSRLHVRGRPAGEPHSHVARKVSPLPLIPQLGGP